MHSSELLILSVTLLFQKWTIAMDASIVSTDSLDFSIWPDLMLWLLFTCQETLIATLPDMLNTSQISPAQQLTLNLPAEFTDFALILHWLVWWVLQHFGCLVWNLKFQFQLCWFYFWFQWVWPLSSFLFMQMQVKPFFFCTWWRTNSFKQERPPIRRQRNLTIFPNKWINTWINQELEKEVS